MKGTDFLEKINDIDADLLTEAEASGARNAQKNAGKGRILTKKSPKWGKKGRAILAACLAALILAGGIPLGYLIAQRNSGQLPAGEPIVFSGDACTTSAADIPDALKTLKVTVDGAETHYLPAGGKLILTAGGPTDTQTLADYVKITPAVPMAVKQNSDTEFVLSPASGTFVPGNIYRVTVGDPETPAISYAFQVETELCLKSVLPADLSRNVPTDTGLEFTFSDTVAMQNFSKFISVSPKVNGSFRLYPDGRTVVFVPNKALAYDTVYTVTVKEGITSVAGKELQEGRTVRFRTWTKEYEEQVGSDAASLLFFIDTTKDYLYFPLENASVNLGWYGFGTQTTVNITGRAYAFPSAEAAYGALWEHETRLGSFSDGEPEYDLSALTLVKEVTKKSRTDTDILHFGNLLEMGIYLIEVTAEVGVQDSEETIRQTDYCFLQITDLRPYTVSCNGELLLWLHNDGGDPVSGAEVEARSYQRTEGWDADESRFDTLHKSTGEDGTCVLNTGDASAALLRIEKAGDTCILCAALLGKGTQESYSTFCYTDRRSYFSTDTVHFWGFIRGRYTGDVPEKMYLTTHYSTRKQEIEVLPDGSFLGEVSLEQMRQSVVYYSLYDENGTFLFSFSVYVTEAAKPVYTAQLTLDKPFYRRGETVTVTLTASFYDGTPAPGLEFRIRARDYGGTLNESRTTDSNGQLQVSFLTGHVNVGSTAPVTFSVWAELMNFETQTLNPSTKGLYYPSNLVFGWSGESGSVVFSLHERNFAHTTGKQDNVLGAPAEGTLTYTLYRVDVQKHLRQTYDSYTKRFRNTWEYSDTKTAVASGTADFVNGTVILPKYEYTGEARFGYYQYDTSFADPTSGCTYGNTVDATVSGWRKQYSKTYNVVSLQLDKEQYLPGETVSAQVLTDGEITPALFLAVGDGIGNYAVTDACSVAYDAPLLGGAKLCAVVYEPEEGTYRYLSEEIPYSLTAIATLDLSVTADREQYRPGDTATVQVRAPEAAGGTVLLSIVDTACLTDSDDFAPFRDTYLNSSRPVQFNQRVVSARVAAGQLEHNKRYTDGAMGVDDSADGDAEENIQTGYYVRRNFENTPVFHTVALNDRGEGTLVFTVPDNITSWRIVALAEARLEGGLKDLRLGCAQSSVITTQPFFISLISAENYVVGDTLTVGARAYGPGAEGTVRYSAVLTDALGQEIAAVSAEEDSKERAWLRFDGCPEGEYTVTVYGVCGEGRDALEARLRVIASGTAADIRRSVTVEDIRTIQPLVYPVTLTFRNAGEDGVLFHRILNRLQRENDANRSDMLAAKYTALWASASPNGGDVSAERALLEQRIRDYGTKMVSLLPYGEEDPELTALICALCPALLNGTRRSNLIGYFYGELAKSQQTDDVSLCVSAAALAALGEPVLDRLYAIASVGNLFSDKAKLNLALGFACAGDYGAARDVYNLCREAKGKEFTAGKLFLEGGNPQTTAELTSLALCVAARVDRNDAVKLAAYLVGSSSSYGYRGPALASYLRFFLPTGTAAEQSFTYTRGGAEETVTLQYGKAVTLQLDRQDFEDFAVTSADAGITVEAAYRGSLTELAEGTAQPSDRVKIAKTAEPYLDGMMRVTLRITGTTDRISESFTVNDTVPAGACLVQSEGMTVRRDDGGGYWCATGWCNPHGQTVSGYVSLLDRRMHYGPVKDYPSEYPFDISFSYIIRGALEGTFSMEPAFVTNEDAGIFAVSDAYRVTVYEKSPWTVEKEP